MCIIPSPFPSIPSSPWVWPQDFEIDRLRRRVAELEQEAEKQRLRQRIEDLERQMGRRPMTPWPGAIPVIPMVPVPIRRRPNVDDIINILERQGRKR